jgi:hypothetical protein
MSIILKKDNIELIQNTNILTKLYFELYNLPSSSEIDQYNKKYKTDFNLQNLREIIADIDSAIPLFDISSQNIYLIPEKKYTIHKILVLICQEIKKMLMDKFIMQIPMQQCQQEMELLKTLWQIQI